MVTADPSPPDPSGAPDRWYLVRAGEVLLTDAGAVPAGDGPLAGLEVPTDGDAIPVGVDGTGGDRAVGVPAGAPAPPGHRWVPLRSMGARGDDAGWLTAGRAVQLVEWQRTSRWCGRCGTATVAEGSDRSMRCPACGLRAYPRVAPAVIVLIHRGDEVLLARNRSFPGSMFSCVAGFVEPGETLEDCVHREVREEVGVDLGEVRYVASQPWPFPHSLMIGFRAAWAGRDIHVDGEEIVEAGWFRAGSLPDLPPPLSIARSLIDGWLRADPV